jgi:hypothetical protein
VASICYIRIVNQIIKEKLLAQEFNISGKVRKLELQGKISDLPTNLSVSTFIPAPCWEQKEGGIRLLTPQKYPLPWRSPYSDFYLRSFPIFPLTAPRIEAYLQTDRIISTVTGECHYKTLCFCDEE